MLVSDAIALLKALNRDQSARLDAEAEHRQAHTEAWAKFAVGLAETQTKTLMRILGARR